MILRPTTSAGVETGLRATVPPQEPILDALQDSGPDAVDTAAIDSGPADPGVVDSAQVDSVAADSAGAIEQLAEGVTETGRLLASGELDVVWARLVADGTGLLVTFVPHLLSALFVGLVFFGLYRVLYGLTAQVLDRSRRVHRGLQSVALRTFRVVGLSLVALMVLAQLGVNVTAIVAGLGITGLALGFAAKDTLENFISGVTILLDKPFQVGDTIRIEDVYGTVEDISLRSTRVRTLANRLMVMPNTLMINQKLINFSRRGVLRVDVDFSIAYKEDIDATRAVVLETVEGDERLVSDPAPEVVVRGLNDSSVDLQLRLFVRDARVEYPLRFEYLEKVRKALAAAGIEIPFPHLQLFIDEAKAFTEAAARVRLEDAGA